MQNHSYLDVMATYNILKDLKQLFYVHGVPTAAGNVENARHE